MNGRMKNIPLWIKLSCKYWQEKSAREKTLGVALEVYEATLVFFIPVDIMEDVVKSVARKLSGSAGPSGTDSESLQGWPLKFGDHSRNICVNVRYFVDCLAKKTTMGRLSGIYVQSPDCIE